MASVALRSVAKAYPGGVRAVDTLDVEVKDREFLVLLGPSGCGKSTTLRLIAGLEEATEGEILIGERVVNSVPPKDRNIAMVFQNYALYPHMTVYRNMAFGLQLRYGGGWLSRAWRRVTRPAEAAEMAVRRQGIRQRVEETARLLGIEPLLQRLPGQLSGGERQRVALGRAMVRQPAVFLFDEPLSNLDAKLRLETRRELKKLHRRLQATMVYVTHDQTEALTLGDRIAVLRDGRLQQIGTPENVYGDPSNRFVAGFIGSPPMNFCDGQLEARDDRLYFTAPMLRQPLPAGMEAALRNVVGLMEKRVVLGVRPAEIELQRSESAGDADAAATGSVVLVEPQGDDSFVEVELAGGRVESKNEEKGLVCRTAPNDLHIGDEVQVRLDQSRLHLFDGESGVNILHGAEATENT